MKKTNHLVSLLRKYIFKGLSEGEDKELTDWANSDHIYKQYLSQLRQNIKTDYADYEKLYADHSGVSQRMFSYIKEKAGIEDNSTIRYFKLKYILAAASVIIAVSFGIYFGLDIKDRGDNMVISKVVPGTNKAFLRLADGNRIDLAESQNGITTENGEVSYIDEEKSLLTLEKVQELEIITPAGGQYQVVLPDGTKVWLNALSSLKYPSSFTTTNRKVELSGEAYFDVAKDTGKPFIVVSGNQEIKVTGTSFNVFAYQEENMVKTTLLKGEVYVYKSSIAKNRDTRQLKLLPGEETLYANGEFKKYKADIAMAVAWKEGSFYFKNTPFDVMIRQIARWYDIEIKYKSKIPTELFTGEMSRKVSLEIVLEFLKGSGIKSELKGKTLFID